MDFSLYKNRLIEYAELCGYDINDRSNTNCFLPTHNGEDKKASMKFYDNERYVCYGCDQKGDIYDLAGLLHNTTDKSEQFRIVEKAFKGDYIPPEKIKRTEKLEEKVIELDLKSVEIVTNYMRKQAELNNDKLLEFAKHRGYGEEFSRWFGYWPGNKQAIKDIGQDVLNGAGIWDKEGVWGKGWFFHGVVVKYPIGFKLMFVDKDGKTVKIASKIIKSFPYPKLPDTDSVTIVEAEISALIGNMNGFNMVSAGGTSGLHKDGLNLLHKYKEVIFCYDADNPGQKANLKKATELIKSGYKGSVKIARLKLQDFGNDPDDYIKSGHTKDLKYYIDNAVPFYIKEDNNKELGNKIESIKFPFKFLGFSEHTHYFFDRKDMITKVPAGKMTSGLLLEIAPLDFWKSIKLNNQGNPDWLFIIDFVINKSNEFGPYIKSSIRGAGVWKEDNEIIVSDGKYIISKTGKTRVRDYVSKNTYVRRSPIGIDCIENKHHEKDFEFLNWIIDNTSFATNQDGYLLFGWIILSIFLSVIEWRPIVYMKGPSEVGKSWIMNHIVRKILDKTAICPKKSSTSIGIMQAPGYDSRMTTIDELEGSHNKKIQELILGIMEHARNTTTNSPESRYIGTQDQEGMDTDFKSMFMFASIVESSSEDQDINRITPINLSPKYDPNWSDISSRIDYEFSNGLGDRLKYNAIFHRESIVKNIHIFQKVSNTSTEIQRTSDQLGSLIAGWYHLKYPGKIATYEEAKTFLKTFSFDEQNERGGGTSIKTILSSILTAKIRYEEEELIPLQNGDYDTRIKMRERPVFEILEHLFNNNIDDPRDPLNKALMAYGIRYGTHNNPGTLVIAQGHEKIRNMLPRDFSYRQNYADFLKTHKLFICKEKSVKFMGTNHQALVFKIDFSGDDYQEPEIEEPKNKIETELRF